MNLGARLSAGIALVAIGAAISISSSFALPVARATQPVVCGTLRVDERSFAVVISGEVTCAFARKWVPLLQPKIAKLKSGVPSHFSGPPGWKDCITRDKEFKPGTGKWNGCFKGEDVLAFKAGFWWVTPPLKLSSFPPSGP